jgi:hypothetical protein
MRNRCPYRADVHRRLVDAARNGRTITYGELGGGRGWIGAYLYRIAHEEDAAGRPPLTALVVRKGTGQPGPGLAEAMRQVGFWKPGESDEDVFRRATVSVWSFWRSRDPDLVLASWHPALTEASETWPRLRQGQQSGSGPLAFSRR